MNGDLTNSERIELEWWRRFALTITPDSASEILEQRPLPHGAPHYRVTRADDE